MNSNQLARNNRNYDKLRGRNVLASGPSVNQANNTNNNNINYNYGSNITAISSDGTGSVPTFHDLEKAKKEAAAN